MSIENVKKLIILTNEKFKFLIKAADKHSCWFFGWPMFLFIESQLDFCISPGTTAF